ncbi:MAG: CRISPR-associated endonuclease Cas2 [Nitrospirae bacterium]|nr:CRISPR-associated endonuclease Cas2 [Nitrospirota bacterium]
MTANYLVCYDITNERRLSRVFRLMKQRGIHIQYSVFYCRLTWQNLVELKGKLNGIINPREDDVRIYPLPGEMKVVVMGLGDRIPEGVSIFLQ